MPNQMQITLNKEKENVVSHALCTEANIYSSLNSSKHGLSVAQYQSNVTTFGKNTIQNKESRKLLRIILEAFFTPFNILLISVGIIDTVINTLDREQSISSVIISFTLILALLIIAAIIKIVFELKAKRINEQLHSNISTRHTVLREGKEIQVSHDEITVGDIVYFHIGDIAPADIRILSICDLSITQATLTGESSSINKRAFVNEDIASLTNDILHISNIVYKGSSVVAGSGQGIVFATGDNTYVGQMANKIKTKRHKTYFERGIYRLTSLLSILAVIACIMLLLIKTLFARYSTDNWNIETTFVEPLVFTLALVINLIPKMTPTLLNMNLSLGASKLYKKSLITKSINRIQSFGAMDIMCLDKTGTLTENNIQINNFLNANGQKDKEVLLIAGLNSKFQKSWTNNIDSSILSRSQVEHITNQFPLYSSLQEIPFDFQRRLMSVVVKHNNEVMMCTKGSLEEILHISSTYIDKGTIKKLHKQAINKILDIANSYNDCGMRILGVAKKLFKTTRTIKEYSKADEIDMQFMGFIILYDPPRLSAKDTIQKLIKYGVEPKILTGDNEIVTTHLCSIVGLKVKGTLTGSQLDSMSDEELKNIINFITVFVKLTPVHKERIIQTLREQQHVVGFLGDGTNDALAMHASDFSVALSNATDTAKQNADFIMKNADINVVGEAVITGRNAHFNIMKYVRYSLVVGINWLVTSLIASFWFYFVPGFQTINNGIIVNTTSQYDGTFFIIAMMAVQGFNSLLMPWDQVDAEEITTPVRFRFNSLPKFAIFFGLLASLFDVIIFLIMIYGFQIPRQQPVSERFTENATIQLFQTIWVVENAVLQGILLMTLRTRKIAFVQSRPGKTPFIGFIASVLVLIAFVFIPLRFSWYMPLSIIPGSLSPYEGLYLLMFLVAVWASAIVMIELAKRVYVKYSKDFL